MTQQSHFWAYTPSPTSGHTHRGNQKWERDVDDCLAWAALLPSPPPPRMWPELEARRTVDAADPGLGAAQRRWSRCLSFSLAFTPWCCLRYHISPRDPHFPSSYPFSPDPGSGAGRKERRSEQRPRGGPGSGPASVVGLGDETSQGWKLYCLPVALFPDKAHFSPPPSRTRLRGPSFPSRATGRRLGPPGRAVLSPVFAQASVRRLRRALRYVAAAGWGEARAPWRSALEPPRHGLCFSPRMRWPRGPLSCGGGEGRAP